MKRSEMKELRRKEILLKALELFVTKGYAGTKTKDISNELGISEGLMFHYFSSKEKIYLELVKLGVEGMELFQSVNDEPYQAFYDVLNDFLHKVRENRIVAKVFILVDRAQNRESTPDAVYNVACKVDTVNKSVEIIKKGQEMGVFRDGDPMTLSYTFWNAVQGIMEELGKNGNMEVPETEWIMAILTK